MFVNSVYILNERVIKLVDHFCMDCNKDVWISDTDMYMLKDILWEQINPKIKGNLCMKCCEKRLGRKLIKEDLILAPINLFNPYFEKFFKECIKNEFR